MWRNQSLWHPVKITRWRTKQLPHDTENICKSLILKKQKTKTATAPSVLLEKQMHARYCQICANGSRWWATTTPKGNGNSTCAIKRKSTFCFCLLDVSRHNFSCGLWGREVRHWQEGWGGRLWSGSACKSEVGVCVLW